MLDRPYTLTESGKFRFFFLFFLILTAMKSVLVYMSSLFSDEGWSPEGAVSVDLRHLEGTTCYCDASAEREIIKALGTLPLNALHWIDGGDFHYLSDIWMRRLDHPVKLVLFDNHPDDQEPAFDGKMLSCGGWVAHSRRFNPMLKDDADDVWLSIDLDYLSRDYARTNWNQGDASLEDLLQRISAAIEGKCLAGVDICGGITSAQGACAEDYAINLRTRKALEDFFRAF